MERPRLKILMSAYACEPGKGSEPEVGWQWARRMARFHDVTVLTRANNRATIERITATAAASTLWPKFVYHDLARPWTSVKKRLGATQLYYVMWQRSARAIVRTLVERSAFDLLHHTTFASYRYPTAIDGHGSPTVWGPVGGMESVPLTHISWSHPRSIMRELARNSGNAFQRTSLGPLRRRAAAFTTVLSSTTAMHSTFADLGIASRLMPTIGIDPAEFPVREHATNSGPLRILYVGNLLAFKGLEFVMEAMARLGSGSTLTLIGSGDQRGRLERLARELGIAGRVHFAGRLARAEVLERYADFDLSVFLSLRDTGGYAVLESMFNEVPVVCFDCGGPALAVEPECGVKIAVTAREQVIENLTAAFRNYDKDRATIRRHGKNARASVLANYSWDAKAAQMHDVYQSTVRNTRNRT
jgi:glycosyltransferase involved in cell wall biosynthesis